jgi:signal transduction histidine kinase/ligand-binding sensor domain-containing protein
VVIAGRGFAEDPSHIDSNYVRTDFTIEDGLPDNTIDAIIQTDNGLLWVGTGSGLASFDGRSFISVRLQIPGAPPPGAINALAVGPNGDLWVGSDAGIVRIPKAELNDPYIAVSSAYRLGKEQSDEIDSLFRARDGTIWAGTNHGLYRFDGKQFDTALSSVYVARISQAIDGHLLLITGEGMLEYNGTHVKQHSGLGASLGVNNNQIFDAFEDARGTMWYGTDKGVRAIGASAPAHFYPAGPGTTATFRIYPAPDGTIWACTGIGVFRVVGDHLQTPAPGLKPRAFYVGRDGDLWIGTNGGGLTHLQLRGVRNYARADGLLSEIVMAVLPTHDGRLWAGMNCGLGMFEGSKYRNFSEKDGLKNSCVWALAEDHEGNLWIGTYGGGLFRYRGSVFTQYTIEQGLTSQIVFKITVARDDTIWIATPDGLSAMKDGRFRNYSTADGLSSSRVLDIHQDRRGTIWVATQGGVDRFVEGRFVPVPAQPNDDVLARRFVEDSLGHLYTTDLPPGISRIENNQLVLLNSTLNLMDMVESPKHELWFSSRYGILRIGEQELTQAGRTDRPLNYALFDRDDGLLTTEASDGSPNIAMTSDGRLWMATVKGLAVMDTSQLSTVAHMPEIFVSGVTSDGKRFRVGDELVLPPGIHHVELNVAAVDLATPRKVRLQYRLEGVDSAWLDLEASRTAVYTNIPVGTHPLLVRATDSLGNWHQGRAIYQVTQSPYFYQTTSFLVVVFVGLGALLLLVYFVRVNYLLQQTRTILEERQVERESVARDLHDTFIQGIQGLILRFHTGTQQLSVEQPVRQLFEEALRQSDKVMLEGRSVLSRLRSSQTTPETLPQAYAAIAHDLRSLNTAEFEIVVSGRARELNAVVQEEVLKIGREALFNPFRHSQASRIEVELHYGIFAFRVRFRDNGIGIDPAVLREGSVPGHFGLPGMRERVTSVGGEMDLWSRPGAGTELEVRIPGAIAYRRRESRFNMNWIRRR